MKPAPKVDFEARRRALEAELTGRPRVLLHVCCAPCATAVVERLRPHFALTLFYCNPNIEPREEYDRRLFEVRRLGEREGLPVWEGTFDPEPFLRGARGLETAPEGGPRCAVCFRLRLEATAARAAAEGCERFCTTLTVSPHKDAALVNRIGEEAGAAAGVPFLPADFKKQGGFLRSVELTRELGLYRQNYCGCRFSRGDRAQERISRGEQT